MNTRIHALARRVSLTTLSARLALYCALRRVSGPVLGKRPANAVLKEGLGSAKLN